MKTLFTPFPILETERLLLRALDESDGPTMFVHRTNAQMNQYIDREKPKTIEDAVAFIRDVQEGQELGNAIAWGICRKGETEIIGSACLWNLDAENRTAELGYSLHPDHWGKGYMSEAVAAILDFGFGEMAAAIVQAYTLPANLASVKLLERLGFVKTGHEDSHDMFTLIQPPIWKPNIETERLLFREIRPADAPFLYALLNSPDWIANIGDRKVHDLDAARKYAIYRIYLGYRKSGFGFYLLERKSDGQVVGICGLIKRDYLDDVDIGYALLPQFYGQGYAVEAARAVAHFAKQALKLPRLAAIAVERNKPSLRVLEKIGLRFERMIQVPGDEDELMLWGMDFG